MLDVRRYDFLLSTAKMAKELTDVPPPGKVELKDLSPALAKYQGHRGTDFLVSAKDENGYPITFTYVRLGVQQYDDFFKTAQEIYALIYDDHTGHQSDASSCVEGARYEDRARRRSEGRRRQGDARGRRSAGSRRATPVAQRDGTHPRHPPDRDRRQARQAHLDGRGARRLGGLVDHEPEGRRS